MITRTIYQSIKESMFKGKAIILYGSRQVGKTSITQQLASANAGADVVVVGNAFEKNPDLILAISNAIHGVASAN